MALSSDRLPHRPPVILWSTPRSASTAFEKAVMQHPDIDVIHEPFTDHYYFGSERRSARYGDCPAQVGADRYRLLAEIGRPRSGRVCFVKELAFQASPYVTDAFLGAARHLFLVNAPDAVYASLVRLKPDFSEDEFGFTALFALFDRVGRVTGSRPPLFTTRAFRESPGAVLNQVCAVAGIPFHPGMLRWERGPIRPWKAHETQSQSRYHRTIESSCGILPPGEAVAPGGVRPDARPIVANAWRIFTALTECGTTTGQRADRM